MIFVPYQSEKDGLWRWRLVAANGRIMADSAEGYIDETNVNDALERMHEELGCVEKPWTIRKVGEAL